MVIKFVYDYFNFNRNLDMLGCLILKFTMNKGEYEAISEGFDISSLSRA
jgi:hypothetical protein